MTIERNFKSRIFMRELSRFNFQSFNFLKQSVKTPNACKCDYFLSQNYVILLMNPRMKKSMLEIGKEGINISTMEFST